MDKPQILKITNWEKYKLSRQSVTKHRKDGLLWIPLYVDAWLTGSVHFELEPDEQATFLDLLLLAAKDNGYIRANEATPYPVRFLAGYLNKTEELIERTIEKCLRPEIDKLRTVPLQECQPPLQSGQPPLQKCNTRVEKSRVEKKREEKSIDGAKNAPSSSAGKTSFNSEAGEGEEPIAPPKNSSPSKASKRKPYHEWTNEEIAEAKPVTQCQVLWNRCYFRLTKHEPVRDFAKDGRLFKLMIEGGWDVLEQMKDFFRQVTEKDEELGGYTVGVFKAWVARTDAGAVRARREKREELKRRGYE